MKKFAVAPLLVVAAIALSAQGAKTPAFEVASVRPGTPRTPQSQRVTETRIDFVNTSLLLTLMRAFQVEQYALVAPAWVNTARFDIHATFPPGTTRQRVAEMLQSLLAERFGLVTHIERRPIEAYELVVGKDGIKMAEVAAVNDVKKDFSTDPAVTSSTDQVTETVDGPIRTMMIPLGHRTVTSRSLYDAWTTAQATYVVNATRITMPELATILTTNVDRPVIDKTGLTGVYQFKVELDSNQSAIRGLLRAGVTTNVRGEPIGQPTGVSTFKAVEGLGLKLEDRRAPFDVVIVDTIEQTPREN